jgi:nicotinamidase-related amidase
MNPAAICQRDASQLVIVDMQQRLGDAMDQDAFRSVVKSCAILLQAAKLLNIPALFTEQYPKGLGATLPELTQWLSPENRVEKTSFSCCEDDGFLALLADSRPQVVLAGMEAHICVLQTALQLQETHHRVYVVEDAVISRNPANKANALQRLRQNGVIVGSTESLVFEWLRTAEHEAFKQISRLVQ